MPRKHYYFPHLCECGCGVIIWGRSRFVHTHHIKQHNPFSGLHRYGKDNPNYGNKWTNEQKLRSHNKMIGRYDGENNPFFNKHHTPESIKKISESHIGLLMGDKNPMKKEINRKIMSEQRKGKNNPMYGMRGDKCPQYGKIGKLCSAYGKPPTHTKRIYYLSPLQGTVCFRSSWEAIYAQYLDSIHELWYYEIETFELLGEMTYTPDFYLPRLGKFIEIKGRAWNKESTKFQRFQEEYPFDLDVLYGKDLKEMGLEVHC